MWWNFARDACDTKMKWSKRRLEMIFSKKTKWSGQGNSHKMRPQLALADKTAENGYSFVSPKTFERCLKFRGSCKSKTANHEWWVGCVSVNHNSNSGDGRGMSKIWYMGIGDHKGRSFILGSVKAGQVRMTKLLFCKTIMSSEKNEKLWMWEIIWGGKNESKSIKNLGSGVN